MNTFQVLIIANDFAGFKKDDIYICRDNEYYVSLDHYGKQFHKDLLKNDNTNFDFNLFSKAEALVCEKLGIIRDPYTVWTSFIDQYNDYSIINLYVEKIMQLYKKFTG